MAIRVGWLPTGTQGAEDTRQAILAAMMQSGQNTARAGTVPGVGGAQPFALTSTGSLSCSVGPGQCWVSPAATTLQGCYPVTVDASGSGLPTISFAAGGSLARTDVIYTQVQDNAEDSSGFTRGQMQVVQGANGGGVPSVPSGALALWQVPVPASASSINFATASFASSLTVALGGVFPSGNSGVPGAAYAGQVRSRTDRAMTAAPGPLEIWDGAAWQSAVPASMPRGLMATPVFTGANGSATSSTTETIDSILGNYQFTAAAGRRYRVVMTGLTGNGSVAGDVFAVRIRDSNSAFTPTAASTLSAESEYISTTAGTPGRAAIPLEGDFLSGSSGTHTLAFFAQRLSGTGVFTPVSGAGVGTRRLYVEDIGNV